MNTEKLVAHRGDNTNYPENTLIAIEGALKSGAIFFEFDVQMNADQRLVVFHDSDFLRMNGKSQVKIMDVSHAKMQELSVHQPKKFGDKYKPTPVSYIEEVISLLTRYPNSHAFVEIKDESLEYWGLERVMRKLVDSLKGYEEQATIISFNHESLAYTKKNSALSIGYVFDQYNEAIESIAKDLKPAYLVGDYTVLPKENLWQGQWKWMVYTVNDIELAKQLLERGDIDFVETDDIQLLLEA